MSGTREWIKALKVGDEVAIDRPYGQSVTLGRVTKTFPSGRWVEVDRRRYGDTGYESGLPGSYSRAHIEPVTDEHRAQVHRTALVLTIQGQKWSRLPTWQLEAIVEVLTANETKAGVLP